MKSISRNYSEENAIGQWSVFFTDCTGSTNADVRNLMARSARGMAYAGSQSSGRGRLPGRQWHSEPGKSLLASLWFDESLLCPGPPSLLSALALVEALKSIASGLDGLRIKWPNDLMLDGRKLAGILCEKTGKTIIAGFGLNLAQENFPGDLGGRATSLFLSVGIKPEVREILEKLAENMEKGPVPDWLDRINAILFWRGEMVRFRQGIGNGPAVSGILKGIRMDGALEILVNEESLFFNSGELSAAGIDVSQRA